MRRFIRRRWLKKKDTSEVGSAGIGAVLPVPAYCPHLNPIEGVWKRLKGFLMPRRFYDSLAELREAVLNALRLLGAVELQC